MLENLHTTLRMNPHWIHKQEALSRTSKLQNDKYMSFVMSMFIMTICSSPNSNGEEKPTIVPKSMPTDSNQAFLQYKNMMSMITL